MTLTEASYWTRRFGVLFIGGFVIIIAIFAFIISINLRRTELDILTPDYACTDTAQEFLQSKLTIPSLTLASDSELLIEIDTASGTLDDNLPLVANVYRYDDPGPSLTAQNEAKDIARKLGFDPELLRRRGTTEYYWNEDEFGRFLSVDAETLNFKLEINYLNPNSLPESIELPTDIEATSTANGFIRSSGWLLEDYSAEEPTVTPINIEPDGTFSMARSRGEAELLRVDFYRSKPFLTVLGNIQNASAIRDQLEDEYQGYDTETTTVHTGEERVDVYNFITEVVNLDTQKSNISVYVGPNYRRGRDNTINPEIYDIDYTSWVIEMDPCGKYPLVPVTTVANVITENQASLVYLNERNGDTVIPYQPKQVDKMLVKQVRLAYLETPERQKYLQPIYIVIGEASLSNGLIGTFYFYTPAVDYDNLRDKQVTTLPVVE